MRNKREDNNGSVQKESDLTKSRKGCIKKKTLTIKEER
jgi:hypothetical protein